MRVAIISDIHSNLEALTVAFHDIGRRSVDRIVCLGDIVGYGASPRECLALVREATGDIVMGNHDQAAFDASVESSFNSYAREAIRWTRAQLSADEQAFLRSLPLSLSFDNLLFVHSTPRIPEEWGYIFSSLEARSFDDDFAERVCFVGHSHRPFVYAMDPALRGPYRPTERYIINPGSIGQPRDGDTRLSYGLLDTVAGSYENFRLEYDVRAAAERITAQKLPSRLAQRLFHGE
jgi:diadenosine tetraphosphatase ApaH/serine/threonine PP2A family protein phosphatase